MSKAKNKGKRSTKGIPENLVSLAEQGKRVRFNGGWLTDSPQDRWLADWIDNTPGAWSVMKAIIYGSMAGGGISVSPPTNDDYPEEFTDVESALIDFDD